MFGKKIKNATQTLPRKEHTPRSHRHSRLLPKGACAIVGFSEHRTERTAPVTLAVLKTNSSLVQWGSFLFCSTAHLRRTPFPRSCSRVTPLAEPGGPVISRRKAFTLSRYVSVRSMCVFSPVSAYLSRISPSSCLCREVFICVYRGPVTCMLRSITFAVSERYGTTVQPRYESGGQGSSGFVFFFCPSVYFKVLCLPK